MEKILVIDDNSLIVSSLVRYYSKMGFSCTGMTNPEKALKLLSEQSFDVVITDIHMYPVNGMEIIRFVKSRPGNTLIIGMSAHCQRNYREQSSRLGADHFFEKPLALKEIDDVLRSRFSFLPPAVEEPGLLAGNGEGKP